MAVFVVIPTEDSVKDQLESLLTSTFGRDSFYALLDRNAFFVQFDGTSTDFALRLNLTGDNEGQNKDFRPCTAIVTNLGTYSGYGPSDFWEWLKARK